VPWIGRRPGYRLLNHLQSQPLLTPMVDVFRLLHRDVFHNIMARGTPFGLAVSPDQR